MILTGPEITAAAQDGRLRITPFAPDQVNPNSYNVRLGPTLLTYTADVLDAHQPNPTREFTIGPDGYVLQPGELYLGHTLEEVGSDTLRCCSAVPRSDDSACSSRSPPPSETSASTASGP